MSVSLRSWLGLICTLGMGLFLVACDSGGTNGTRSVAGPWEGTVDTDSVTYDLSFDVERDERDGPTLPEWVGDGQLVGEDAWAFQITEGSFMEPNRTLSLTFRFETSPSHPIQLHGTVGEDYQQVEAELDGGPPDGSLPDFEAMPITLTRP